MRSSRLMHWALGGMLAFGIAATAHADLRTTYQAGPLMYPGADPDYPQQAAVNKNIGSPYYGYLYIADYRGGADVPKMIHIWKPVKSSDGTGAAEYVDSGLEIATPDMGQFDPFAVAVGPDDTVWIGEYTTGVIATAPPVPSTGTSVTATPQITGVGNVRGMTVVGPITNATVYLAGTTAFVSKYTGSATAPDATGTFTQAYNATGLNVSYGPYGPAVDLEGNAYIVAKSGGPGSAAFIKLDASGNVVPFAAVVPPNFPSTSDLSSASFVADKSYPGGGYLYAIQRTGYTTNGGDMGIRYDLAGNYLDGYGPAVDPAPANYTVLSLTRNNTYGDTDDLGNVIQKVSVPSPSGSGSNGGYQKIIKLAPFVVDAAGTTSAGGAVKSSPTAVDGVVYFGADDGKLYAYTTADGNPVSGFPVDVAAAVGTAVKIQSRAAVYVINPTTAPEKYVYFTTDLGHVGRVKADGTGLQIAAPPVPGANNTGTPAVMPDGTVYVGLSHPDGCAVAKLNPDMSVAGASPLLGGPGSSISSVAVDGNNVFVGLTGGLAADIIVLNAATLTPLVGPAVATGEGVTAPPYVKGAEMYVGTLAGNFYKVNAATGTPDAAFGTAGAAAIGEALPTSPFILNGKFYVGSAKGKVWQVDATSGASSPLYDTGDATASLSGVVVNPETNTIAFGTSAGIFYQIPEGVSAAQVFRGYGAFNSTPTYDRASKRFLIGSDDQNVYAFSSR